VSRLPVCIVGAGTRAAEIYGPLLTGPLADKVELLGIIGRSPDRVAATAKDLGVRASTHLEDAQSWGARAVIACVSPAQNASVAHAALDSGLPCLLETPLALDLQDARALADRVASTGIPVAVAEQNPRHLGSRLIVETVRRGVIGEPLLVATDGAGYRYHAVAVARAVLGRPRGRLATGQRVLAPSVDVGRGAAVEEILVGTVRAEGGALLQFRDAEAAWVEDGPWSRGTGRVLGTRGEFVGGSVVSWDGTRRPIPVEPIEARFGTETRRVGLRLLTDQPIEVLGALPEAGLDDDRQAVAGCVLDWLAQLGGAPPGWSVADGYADLCWTEGIARSARLGGAPIALDA